MRLEPTIPAAGKIHWDGVVLLLLLEECAQEISPASTVLENAPHFPSILLFGHAGSAKCV